MKLPYALYDGLLVHISEVLSGLDCDCHCPACGETLIAKKGVERTHHFAHKAHSQCAESYFHYIAKYIVYSRINQKLNKKKHRETSSLEFVWYCNQGCGNEHRFDLLKTDVCDVAVEQDLGECQPDITLLDRDGNPKCFIEVIYTHSPEHMVYEFAKRHGIVIIEFNVSKDPLLRSLDMSERALYPSFVSLCMEDMLPTSPNSRSLWFLSFERHTMCHCYPFPAECQSMLPAQAPYNHCKIREEKNIELCWMEKQRSTFAKKRPGWVNNWINALKYVKLKELRRKQLEEQLTCKDTSDITFSLWRW